MNNLAFFLSDEEDNKLPPLITTKIKDDVLQWLSERTPVGSSYMVDMPALLEAVGVDMNSDSINAIFEHFVEMGLIDHLKAAQFGSAWVLRLKVNAHTFIQRGGFAVEDALTEANIQKILFELKALEKQLKPDRLEAANKIAAIGSAIATVLTTFHDKN